MNQLKNKISFQVIWYLLGTILPMGTLFFRSPIYTRIYSPELFGKYTLVYVTFTYLSALLFQWITSSSWRYYSKYKVQKRVDILTQTATLFYSVSISILIVISVIWVLIVQDEVQKQLIILGFLFASTQELINTLMIPMRMKSEARKYNIIISLRAILSFGLLLVLTFIFNFKIEAFFIAPIIINILLLILIVQSHKKHLKSLINIRLSRIKPHLKRFFVYGLSTFFFTLCIFLLTSSDRYIILLFNGFHEVGIYNQTYNIASMSISAVLSAINAALNPVILSNLESKPNKSDILLSRSFYFAVYISLPFTVIFSLLSKQITDLLLGPEFRAIFYIMPFVFFSSFLFGISHYASIKLKFQNKLKELFIISGLATLVNIILNFWLIPRYGYTYAAHSTLAAYIFLAFGLFSYARIHPLQEKGITKKYINVIIALLVIIGVHFSLQSIYPRFSNTLILSVFEGGFLVLIYYLITLKNTPLKSNYLESYEPKA